jgi:hypothetical protein
MSDDEGSQRRSEILYPRESAAVENSPRVSSLNETKSRLAVDETRSFLAKLREKENRE